MSFIKSFLEQPIYDSAAYLEKLLDEVMEYNNNDRTRLGNVCCGRMLRQSCKMAKSLGLEGKIYKLKLT
jgi:hypothetical protein